MTKILPIYAAIVAWFLSMLSDHPAARFGFGSLGILILAISIHYTRKEDKKQKQESRAMKQDDLLHKVLDDWRIAGTPERFIDRLTSVSPADKAELLDRAFMEKKGRLPTKNKYRESK